MLLQLFQRLVDAGHSLVVIEHNLEVIKSADWIIDLGPEAGDQGGEVVAIGTPEQVAKNDRSHTGRFLKRILAKPARFSVIPSRGDGEGSHKGSQGFKKSFSHAHDNCGELTRVAEAAPRYLTNGTNAAIAVHGAREHNLKNIDVAIPRDQMVIITGLSGSGKSTLAFDILFSEGQRRFLDSLSPYARQFAEQLEKPDVDLIEGLPPSVAIEQRVTRGGGKSTVATVTEVYHFLRLLFAKTGTQFCPDCDLPVEKQSLAAIVKQIETAAKKGALKVLAPVVKARKGFHTDVARWAERQAFDTLYVDGTLIPIAQFRRLERFKEHSIAVVVGVIDAKRIASARDVARRALEIGRGTAHLLDSKNRLTVMSTEMSCPNCGRAFEELDPRLFSFNSPHGMCKECGGEWEIWRVAVQIGSNLRGVLYVLDEPTIGLHARDNLRLLETLTALRNKGNSLIVVEHDEETMRRADHIVDLGPRAGIHGGEVVAAGTLRKIERNPNSETARCLKAPMRHPIRGSRRALRNVENWIKVRGARANNLKNVDVRFPVGRLSVITGISGSGKSTLMHDVILT